MNNENNMENAEVKTGAKKSVIRDVVETVLYLAAAMIIALLIVKYVGQRTQVDGDSMQPTLYDKQNLILDKISYRFNDPERYDIIVFPFEGASGEEHFIKRIIGMPGESVQILNGYVYINGEKLESDIYGKELIENPGRAKEPITLGEDEYFVLGDNRNNSRDSRFTEVGNIKREDITGRAFFRIWPLSEIGLLKHE